jgi:hypothetical protein
MHSGFPNKRRAILDRRFVFISLLAILPAFCGGMVSAQESGVTLNPHSIRIRYLTDKKQVNYVVDQFRNQLRRTGSSAGIIACIHVTEVAEEGIKNSSFGAVCTVQNGNDRLTVLMCGDSLGGKFSWEESGDLSAENVARFIRRNCPCGG